MAVRAYGKSVQSYTAWAASTEYSLEDYCVPTTDNGMCYECTTTGTSDSSIPTPLEPTWPNIVGQTVVDGTVTWTCRDKTASPSALSVILNCSGTGGFAHKDIWVKSDSEENLDFIVYGSFDGVGWRQIDELNVPHANRDNRHKGFVNSYDFIKVETDGVFSNEIEIVGGE